MDEEKIRNLISIYQGLPPEMQNAVLWILEHIDIVDYLAQGEETPENKIEDLIQKAIEKKAKNNTHRKTIYSKYLLILVFCVL